MLFPQPDSAVLIATEPEAGGRVLLKAVRVEALTPQRRGVKRSTVCRKRKELPRRSFQER